MKKTIFVSKKELNFINDLLSLNGQQIYKKYGLQRNDVISNTAVFPNDVEIDIKLVIGEDEDYPYTEGILFVKNAEALVSEPEEEYEGEWKFVYDGKTYTVLVKEK